MAWAPSIISFLILFDIGYGVLIPPPFGWARSKKPKKLSQHPNERTFDFSIGTFPPIPWHGKPRGNSKHSSRRDGERSTKLNDVRHEKPHEGLGNEVITRLFIDGNDVRHEKSHKGLENEVVTRLLVDTNNPGLPGTIVEQNEDYAQRILTPLEEGSEVSARFGNIPTGFGDYGRGGYGYYGSSPTYDDGDSYYSDDDYGLYYRPSGSPEIDYDSPRPWQLFKSNDPMYGLPEHGYNPSYGYDPLDFDYTIDQQDRPEYYSFDDLALRMDDSRSKKRKKRRKSKRGSNRSRRRRDMKNIKTSTKEW